MSFVCFYCSKHFKQKVSLKDHIIKKICFIKKEHRCWCGKECISPAALKVHKSKFHSCREKFETTSLTFGSFSEFSSWKEALEDDTSARFVKVRGVSMLKSGAKKIVFVCHRSGKIRLKTGERQRATRKKGSCKLNAKCPAFIRIEEHSSGFIKVEYYSTHRNHKNDIQHLTLTRKEREQIANELNKGATIEEVLEEIRFSSVSNEDNQLKRIHIVSKADLTNIIKEFKISFKERLAKDITCVHSLVQECNENFEYMSPIKLFKPQNIDGIEGMEGANPEDFILIIMTHTQKFMLMQCEYNKICVDSTHKSKGFEFHLTTILVIFGAGISLPVAYCISNSVNESTMGLFFSTIRKECGNIATPVFTSHDAPIFINSWCKVMSVPEKWQVDKNLQQNLQTMKISTEGGSELDTNVRNLIRELDEQVLSILLKKFVTKCLEHAKTNEFAQFFVKEYLSSTSMLDVNYKRHVEIHTNLKLCAMLRVLKNAHFKNLKMRRLDFSIFRLLKICWDSLFNRMSYIVDESDEYTFEILADRHASALLIPRENIIKINRSYQIKSESNSQVTYTVALEKINCSCLLRCIDCDTCLHVYLCTCIDYSIAGNFCKHVHAVSIFEKSFSPVYEYGEQEIEIQEEIVMSTDDIPSSITDQENLTTSSTKDELIEHLIQMTNLLRTRNYNTIIYNESMNLIKQALNLFNDVAIFEPENGEIVETVTEKDSHFHTSESSKCETPKNSCFENKTEELETGIVSKLSMPMSDICKHEVICINDIPTS